MNRNPTHDELLDLVDEDDHVIGEVERSIANSSPGFIHREVAVMIYDEENRMLFQLRSRKKKIDPGVWIVSCAGHVTKGLNPEEAAQKELKEELGFSTELKFIERERYDLPTESRFFYIYAGKYPGSEIVLDKDEAEDSKFLSEKEFNNLVKSGVKFGDHTKRLVKKFWSTL